MLEHARRGRDFSGLVKNKEKTKKIKQYKQHAYGCFGTRNKALSLEVHIQIQAQY